MILLFLLFGMILMCKMKKKILIILVILIFLVLILMLSCMLWDRLEYENKQRYEKNNRIESKDLTCEILQRNYVYIVTESDYNGEINYYKIDGNNNVYESRKFEYKENKRLSLSRCFDSYIDHDKNKVLNKLTMNTCKVLDNDDNEVQYNDDILSIIKLISKLEHEIVSNDIVVLNNEYYVIVSLNVNWWTPYSLYKYENNTLKKVITLDGENIIAIKKK